MSIVLDKSNHDAVFIHNSHESVNSIARKPRSHAGVFHNVLNTFKKERRAFFDRKPKKALARSTYRAFVQAVHNVIHKDCGQFFRAGLNGSGAVNTPRAKIGARRAARPAWLAAADLAV
ncbi:MAG TPA: hypothetical protein VF460_14875 [Burkholderiales bacterium]